MLSIVEQAAGDPQVVTQALIDAANNAGGKDNITVVFVEGDRFAAEVRRRSSATRKVPEPRSECGLVTVLDKPLALSRRSDFWLDALWPSSRSNPIGESHPKARNSALVAVREPRTLARQLAISAPPSRTRRSGDTVIVAPGQYHEQIILKDGVNLISEQPRQAVIRAAGIAVQANDIHSGRFEVSGSRARSKIILRSASN